MATAKKRTAEESELLDKNTPNDSAPCAKRRKTNGVVESTKLDSTTQSAECANKPSTSSKSPPAAAWSFTNTSWVKQSSDETSATTSKFNDNPTSSFSKYTGLGFGSVLDTDKASSDKPTIATKTCTKTTTTTKPCKDKTKTKLNDSCKEEELSTSESAKKNTWGNWSNSNADGTFRLNFNWGSWESADAKIDLNASSGVGWGSTATPISDPDLIEQSDSTKKVADRMAGEQDTGDADDDTRFAVQCKVFNLKDGAYVERGRGELKINMYCADDKKRARILCRREVTLKSLINAPLLKEMEFAKVGKFVRFGVAEVVVPVVKEKSILSGLDGGKKDEEDEEQDEGESEEKTKVTTYLVRVLDASKMDTLISKIKEVQQLIA